MDVVRLGATPFVDKEGELLPTQESQEGLTTASGSINSSEGHGNSEGDSNSHVDSHSQGSRHSDPQIAEFQVKSCFVFSTSYSLTPCVVDFARPAKMLGPG